MPPASKQLSIVPTSHKVRVFFSISENDPVEISFITETTAGEKQPSQSDQLEHARTRDVFTRRKTSVKRHDACHESREEIYDIYKRIYI